MESFILILTDIKYYDTNIKESVITNDFLFSSNRFVNSISSKYNIFKPLRMQKIQVILKKIQIMSYMELLN